MSRSKAKGTSFERQIADYLRDKLDRRIDRHPLHGTNDVGDISGVVSPFGPVVVECKNVKAMSLGAWIDEAETERGNADALVGVVVHKRRGKGQPEDQFVTLTVRSLIALLGGPADAET